MTDAGQHQGALFDLTLDARAHVQKRLAGLAHFGGPGDDVADVLSLAEGFRCAGKAADRADLVSQKYE